MANVEIVVTSGSGDGRAVDTAHRLQGRLTARGHSSRVRCFRTADAVREWAARCAPTFSHLACVGGDGTLSAAAGAAARLAVPLVPVPSGFGNVFARALGHRRGATAAVDLVERGPVRRADVGRAGDEIFLCHRSYGVLEEIQRAVESGRAQPRARLRRQLAYYATAAHRLRGAPLPSIDVAVDGRAVAEDSALVTVANVETYRGFLTLTPDASPFDGVLDVCIIPRTSKVRLLLRLMALLLKLPGRWEGVRLVRGRQVAVTVRGAPPETLNVAAGVLAVALPADAAGAPAAERAVPAALPRAAA